MSVPERTGARGKPHLPVALIEAAQQGERLAIDRLLALSQPDIRLCARINSKIDDIDDAVQDAMWLVYRRIGARRMATSFSSWLFEIVRRECQRVARRALRMQPREALENDVAAVRQMAGRRFEAGSGLRHPFVARPLPDHHPDARHRGTDHQRDCCTERAHPRGGQGKT
jgi:DNA-directed RNA polymerase specialized sigma24 family protein